MDEINNDKQEEQIRRTKGKRQNWSSEFIKIMG